MSLSPKLLSCAVLMALAGTAAASPAQRALDLIQANPHAFKATSADRFVVRAASDHGQTSVVRLERTYRGLEVLEGDMVMLLGADGSLKNVNMTLRAPLKLGIRPSIKQDDAITAAGLAAGNLSRVPSAKLIISNHGSAPTLAWKVTIEDEDSSVNYFIGAGPDNGGDLLFSTDNHQTSKPSTAKGKPGGGGGTTCANTAATGSANTLYSGVVSIGTTQCSSSSYQMKDQGRGGGYTTDMNGRQSGSGTIFTDSDNNWGNGSVSDRATAGADAHYGVAETWDFYATLGRSGIANDGKGALSRVHYGRNYVNAFWSDSCFCMTFGDGNGTTYGPLVDLDVAGHEMSHGVMSREANLTYSGESGGLNEANSDIMGSMVEFYSNSPIDTPDYLIGEEIYISNPGNTKALRWMFDPSKDGRSPNCYSGSIGSLDVHYSSGVANHFFYLLAEGTGQKFYSGVDHSSPTCNGTTHAGIGRAAATQIWYRAVRDYMTSGTNYAGARTTTLQAAAAIYGANSSQYNAVAAAWSAVGVN